LGWHFRLFEEKCRYRKKDSLGWLNKLCAVTHGLVPDTYGVGGISIATEARGKGFAGLILKRFKENANKLGLGRILIAVRPTLKHLYPLVEQYDYTQWKQRKVPHLPFDPWLRLHGKNGGVILGILVQEAL
jgi:hypothetical protein